jgi:hypothetical protein
MVGLFYDELARPEYAVRFKWEPGSIAFWDNRSTVHLAPTDLTIDHDRRLYRVTSSGMCRRGRMDDRQWRWTANRSTRSNAEPACCLDWGDPRVLALTFDHGHTSDATTRAAVDGFTSARGLYELALQVSLGMGDRRVPEQNGHRLDVNADLQARVM